ncbi:MAG: efflux RND transporter permease subunit, partial [Bacteroidota bacterium]
VVAVVVVLSLFHWRSALSILIQVPVTIATSFILLRLAGIDSNIMSLTGIALAIGVIADNGIIMAENATRHLGERQAQLNS